MSFFAIRRASAQNMRAFVRQPTSMRIAIQRPAVRYNSSAIGPAKSSKTGIIVGLALAAAAGGGGYYVYTSQSDTARTVKTTVKEGAQVTKALTNYVPAKEDYQKVYNKIASILENSEYDGALSNLNSGQGGYSRESYMAASLF
jgi:cytochrome c peroxidase